MQEIKTHNSDITVAERARNYDHHYLTAGWKVERWTKERIENFLAYSLDVDKGGRMNGNEIQFALSIIGTPDLRGLKILDYCCGTGITSIYFALCGAEVWAFDASSKAIEIAAESAKISNVSEKTHFDVVDARSLPYKDGFFDAVFCQSALHIVIDYPKCPYELSRVLKHRGKAVFCDEGLGYNPLLKPIRWLRRRKWVKCGGRPLKYTDIENFAVPFSTVQIQHFNLFTQVKTAFKGQLHKYGGLRPWTRKFLQTTEKIDNKILSAIPFLKRYCGAIVVSFEK